MPPDPVPVNSVDRTTSRAREDRRLLRFQTNSATPPTFNIPVGNAGNITAYWLGYNKYKSRGWSSRLPRMMGYQRRNRPRFVLGHPIDNPHTVATAIKIGNPAELEIGGGRARLSGQT